MTARTTLAPLLSTLRGYTDAGTADYSQTGGTAVFWDDDQLQAVLDRHRMDVRRIELSPHYTVGAGGTAIYQDYYSGYENFEATTGGTAIFVVEDGTGADAGTALWSADYARGVVTFAANTLGTAYYLTGRSYDLYGAAADVWRTKAGQAAAIYDISTDNHSLSRSQIMEHAMEMCQYYTGLAGPQVTTLLSDDYCA